VSELEGTAGLEGYTVTRRPGKRRPPVTRPATDDGTDGTIRSGRPSEAAGRERPKVRARRKDDPGTREGHGEGQIEDQADELDDEAHAPW
jgi:hypothetical protein